MKISIAALLLLAGSSLYAQKSAYLKAEAGFGRGGVREFYGSDRSRFNQPGSANRYAISGGVQVKKLSVEIGFGMARTGAKSRTDFARVFCGSCPPPAMRMQFTSYTLPLTIGYNAKVARRWSFQPRMGVEAGYLQSATYSYSSGEIYAPERRVTGANLRADYKSLSLHATGALQLHYRVTPGIEVYGGPSYRHMLTNGAAETLYTQPPYYKLRTGSTTFDAGVMLRLNRPKTAPKPSMPVGPQE